MRRLLSALAFVLLLPAVSAAAIVAQQPNDSTVTTYHATNISWINLPGFTATGNHSLGSEATIAPGPICGATSTGLLKFSARVPSGRNLIATLFHDTATPTPHTTNYVFWGALPTCAADIAGNDQMTDYSMPISLPIPGGGLTDTGILDGEAYHIRMGEQAGFPIDVDFKTDASGNIAYQLLDAATSSSATTTPPSIVPVIIIPGILGSAERNGHWEIDPILHSFDDLISTFTTNGYSTDVNLFTFAYDWRRSNIDTAKQLKQRINEVRSLCKCNKVNLVAHSMGGLVARQYIESSDYEGDVDKLIFLGTPQMGSPKAYLMWEAGEIGPVTDIRAEIEERILLQEAREKGYGDLYSYVQNNPIASVQELLPIYPYIFDGLNLRSYPGGYPANPFLENLDLNKSKMYSTGIAIYNFVGNTGAQGTLVSITATGTNNYLPKWKDGFPNGYYDVLGSHGLNRGDGDGTVPYFSGSSIQATTSVVSSCHVSLPSLAASEVFSAITGHEPSTHVSSHDICNLRVAIFRILSPADIEVIDPNGRRTGKDFLTGQEFHEIPDAFYTGFNTDTEFVTILNPVPGQYKLLTQGTGIGGKYTVETDLINNASTTTAIFNGQTGSGQITEHNVDFSLNGPGTLQIAPADLQPPMININQPSTTSFTRKDNLLVSVTISDPSGVATSSIAFDATTISASTTIDLFYQELGDHSITVSAQDFVNNSTSSARLIRLSATVDSVKYDVSRAYTLGWLRKDLRDLLLFQLEQVTILKKVTSTTKTGTKVTTIVQIIDRVLLQTLLKELQAARLIGTINQQGYQTLTADINWLINHN